MTDTDAEEPAEREESFWASLSSDMRLFVTTLGATVGANVITVMLVALAIWLNRLNVNGDLPIGIAYSAVVMIMMLATTLLLIRFTNKWDGRQQGKWLLGAVLCGTPVILLLLLTLLGYAAGLK